MKKSEYRISKYETNSNVQNNNAQNLKDFHISNSCVLGCLGFWNLIFRYCFGFRASDFEFYFQRVTIKIC